MDFARILKPFGERKDSDTQFIALIKGNQEVVTIMLAVLAFGLLYLCAMPFMNQPATGTWRYGICKIFLERYAQYPENLKILYAREGQSAAKIGYLITNSYGSRESEEMECFYNLSQGNVTLNRVTINRRTLRNVNPGNNVAAIDEDRPLTPETLMEIYDRGQLAMRQYNYSVASLEDFNKTIPVILANKDNMDLELPNEMPKSLRELKFQ